MALEIEHKLLLRSVPDAGSLVAAGASPHTIEQVYLRSEEGASRRIRRSRDPSGRVTCTLTEKRRLRPGVREEDERQIDEQRYRELLAERDPAAAPVRKTRWKLQSPAGELEIDVFDDLELALVELEVADEDALAVVPELPPFLEIERDVTHEPAYTNAALARRLAAAD